MKRFAALVAAALIVVGALAFRQARDDDHETGTRPEAAVGIVCAADLAEVCAAAGVEVVATPPAGETADALVASEEGDALGGSAWLVTSAWASLAQAERDRANAGAPFGVVGEPLASSEVVVALWEDRAAQLAERCELPPGRTPGWRCLAEQAGSTLGAGDRVQIARAQVDSAVGLVIAASQATGVVGRSDFATNDPEAQDLVRLAPALAGGTPGDLVRMRSRGPGEITAAGTVRASAQNRSSTLGTIAVTTPEPRVRADVVLVVPAGGRVDDDTKRALIDALLAAGWDPSADGPDGLPSGGVLAAIRTLWAQNR